MNLPCLWENTSSRAVQSAICKTTKLIYLLYLLMLTSYIPLSTAAFSTKLHEECNELAAKSQCQCMPMSSFIHIDCPVNDPKLSIEMRAGNYVMIECYNISYKDYKLLPNMAIGNISQVKMQDCPLPGHLSIASILQQLGVKQYTTLLFDNNSDLGTNATRNHLSELHGLRRLRFGISRSLHMPQDLFYDYSLRNLTWLDLRSNNVVLPVDIFSKLKNLDYLELGFNRLKSLPQGIFRNQHKLHVLNLWSNELRNLSKNIFEGATALTDLDLSNNGIETFRPDVFELLTNLTTIILNANHFKALPEDLFKKNRNLSKVNLIHNRVPLRSLPAEFFANLSKLKEVRLTCDLESLPGNLFTNSSNIATISIKGNKLSNLPEDLFESQHNLIYLDLSQNYLTLLPEELFRNTRKLVNLKFSNNQLTKIQENLFSTVKNLKTLDLSNNRLTTIDQNAFAGTQHIQEINLENNLLTLMEPHYSVMENIELGISSPFQHVMHLRKLNLRNNSIMYIYHDWKYQLVDLEELDLSYNNISAINENDFQFVTRNELKLNLTHNKLRMVNLHGIETLQINKYYKKIIIDLNNNPIECNCVLLSFVQYLRGEKAQELANHIVLDISNLSCNHPENLKDKPVKYVNPMDLLCPLDHKDTNPKLCPRGCNCWVRTLDKVLMVNCSNGNFTKIPGLPRIEQLSGTELYLENNQLMKLPVTKTPGYAEVAKLYIAGNNLSSIDIHNLPAQLVELDVRNNQLEYLNTATIHFLNKSHSLHTLYLSENPWMCTCEAKSLLIFVKTKYNLIRDFSNMTCSNFIEPRYFSQLTIDDICSENELYIAVSIAIVTAFVLLGCLVILFCNWQKVIKIWIYARNRLCLWFVTKKEVPSYPTPTKTNSDFISLTFNLG